MKFSCGTVKFVSGLSILAGSSLQIDGMALPFSQLDQPGPSVDPPPTAPSLRLRSDENEGKGRECNGLSRWSQAALAVVRCAMQLSGHLIRDIYIDNHPYIWYLARLGVQSHVTALSVFVTYAWLVSRRSLLFAL